MKRYIAFILAFLALPAMADSPLPAPEKLEVCSPSGKVCATSDPGTNITLVSSKNSRQKPWKIPGWHRWLLVSDDGESVVVGYSGLNLVPADVTLKQPVLFFYNKGKLVRTLTLGDLYKNKSQLKQTVSHYAWVNALGINQANQLVVELVDGKKIAFAASTGQRKALIPDRK